MDRAAFLYDKFLKRFKAEPTPCQEGLFQSIAEFATSDDADILIVNGYAGTGKTTAVSAAISALRDVGMKSVLLAPTGRAAKVLAQIAHRSASTIHKHIYRQKSMASDGFGKFSLQPNKSVHTLFVVDEVSLIGTDSKGEASASFGSGNLLDDLVRYVREGVGCRLLLIGDCAQLPPVGLDASPALLEDYMRASFGGVQYCTLTSVVRQASESGILRNATLLRSLISESEPWESFSELKLELSEDVIRLSGAELIDTISDAYGEFGEDGTIVLTRSNKLAIRYNLGIRSRVHYKEDRLVRDDKLMVVKNCYQFLEEAPQLGYIANGDIARLLRIGDYEERYGLHFATARLAFEDYDGVEIDAKIILDALESESPALTREQSDALYAGVSADYADRKTKARIYKAVREDKYFNALQIKYAQAITCHKSQGGQWDCVFVHCPFAQAEQSIDDLKWLYTALTRAVKRVYLVNFPDRFFAQQ